MLRLNLPWLRRPYKPSRGQEDEEEEEEEEGEEEETKRFSKSAQNFRDYTLH